MAKKSNLVPFSKNEMKKLGIVETKNGPMIDSKRLSSFSKFQRPKQEEPPKPGKRIVNKSKPKEISKKADIDKGIY